MNSVLNFCVLYLRVCEEVTLLRFVLANYLYLWHLGVRHRSLDGQ